MKEKNKILFYARWVILALILGFITYSAYLHQTLGGDKAASIHALCPFGGLESLYVFFKSGTFISKIYTGTMILFFITLVLAILFRRSFCGLICPFGALQELFGKVGQKIFGKNFVMPALIDKLLRYMKYVVLALTVGYAWYTAGLWMSPYDPWSVYAHIAEGFAAIWEESPVGVILLIITLLGSLLYDRFFCKYLCPMGALYGIIGKLSPYKVSRDENTCVNCKMCSKVCPVNIDVANSKDVTSAECLNCQICVLECPKKGALENKFGKKSLTPIVAISLVLVLFFAPVMVAKYSGIFQTTPEAPVVGEIIEFGELKGFMTIKDGSTYTGMSIDTFYKTLKIPENVPETTKLKEISNIAPDYNFDAIKHDLEEQAELEAAAAEDPCLTCTSITSCLTCTHTPAPTITPTPNPYRGKIDPYKVKGSMTIREAAFTVETDVEEFYKMFQIPKSVPDTTKMKEISTQIPEYDFEDIKASLE